MTALILASSSPIRARILREAGVAFGVLPAKIDEAQARASMAGADGETIAGELAVRKALWASERRPGALTLGADQVLVFDGAAIGKASSVAAAAELLRALRGRRHALVASLALAKGGSVIWRHSETVRLWMRAFSEEFLEAYLATEGQALLACVGCYRFEGFGAQLFERVEGDYFAILGLPLLPLLAALRDRGALPS
ncbi:MAG TPA: Maf family protein [Rhizomicrobium sp.]|nr:Maf family protein [Rhizomicrobium sp.]